MIYNLIKKVSAVVTALIFAFSMYSFGNIVNTTVIALDYSVPVISFNTDSDYKFENKGAVNKMTYGKASLGSVTINGDFNDTSTYKDSNGKEYVAYGLQSGQFSLSYEYDGALLDENGKYYLVDDSSKKYHNAV